VYFKLPLGHRFKNRDSFSLYTTRQPNRSSHLGLQLRYVIPAAPAAPAAAVKYVPFHSFAAAQNASIIVIEQPGPARCQERREGESTITLEKNNWG